MDRLEYILGRLPGFYNTDQNSRIRAIVKAFSDEMVLFDDQMDYVDGMIGINTTFGGDLDRRWGHLLGIDRMHNEDDDIYRNRLKMSVTNLVGGTEGALRYTISVVLGITNADEANRRIAVTDAWIYPGDEPVDRSYGCSVCVVDLDGGDFSYKDGIESAVQQSIDRTKASGTKVQLIFTNYRLTTYDQMQDSTHVQLSAFRYNQIGDTK